MSGIGPFRPFLLSGIMFLLVNGGSLKAQDTIYQKLLELEKEVNSLKKIQEEQNENAELEALMEEADRLSRQEEEHKIDLSKKYASGVRQQQGLNPNISFGMDFFGGVSTSDAGSVSEVSDINYGNNGFFLREAQLSLIAPLDPFTRGKAFISATPEGFVVDEAYIEWLNLPLSMNLKAGIFKPEFGFLNRYHDHALPQFDRPRVLTNLFGKGGLGGAGIATNFLLPPLIAHASSLDLSLIYGSNAQGFRSESNEGFVFTGLFLNYYDLSASSYLELRLSGAAGKTDLHMADGNSYVGSAGIAYKWTPVGREKYRTLEWKTEFLYGHRERSEGSIRSKGFYSSVQNKLSARFWLGGRLGYSEIPYDPGQYEWDYTLSVDFWQSEFVLTRLQYQYNNRDIYFRTETEGPYPTEHSFIIQVVWAMGPHKHEAY
ncbi:MAG: hypothetical protein ABFS28_13955 [Bacteroidota bacterium]